MDDYISHLKIQINPAQEQYQVIEFQGDMDKAGLLEHKAKIEEICENFPHSYLVFDLTNLNFINSESIGFLMSVHSHLVKEGKKLTILNTKPNVKDILEVIGLFNIIEYYDSLSLFLEKNAK